MKTLNNEMAVAHPNVYIEFAGMPGAGKSTLATNLTDKLRERGYTCPQFSHMLDLKKSGPQSDKSQWLTPVGHISNRCKSLDLLLLSFRSPYSSYLAYLYLSSIKPFNINSIRVCRRLLKWIKLYGTKTEMAAYDYIVFDDALLQTAMSLAWEGDHHSKQALENLLKHFITSTNVKFIILLIDSQTALKRINIRAEEEKRMLSGKPPYNWRFFYSSKKIQQEKITQANRFFMEAASILKRLRPDIVLEITAQDAIETTSEKIINFILPNG